ncbi:regulator of chromosome condensation [Trypanosoma theileri]|uniref:Regulator of chromosome condensation n=1 Tax=Trypanosoma theileri TaxID=67003 RepID=A0A1X0NSD6_9TRYP|nr:regulator of chromosome condensation [Trypanosoma theileri]ORC87615.1 regulator of chromosome condensation [Trypanosoma theileri]
MSGTYGPLGDLYMDLDASEDVRHLLRRYIEGDGVLLGWGLCRDGELGTGARGNLITPLIIYTRDKPLRVGCSSLTSYWLGAHGTIFTMGSGSWGELGVDNPKMCPLVTCTENGLPIAVVQVELPAFSPENMLVDVQGGFAFVASLTVRGDVFLWGANNYGQCTRMMEIKCCAIPQRLRIPGEKVIQVGCSNYGVLALTASGSIYGWGYIGLLGEERSIRSQVSSDSIKTVYNGNEPRITVIDPIRVNMLENKSIVSLRVGPWHAVAISSDGKAYSWGMGKNGRLGHGNEDNVMTPKLISTLGSNVVEASCGSFHTCFVTKDGSAFACGDNKGGQCGVVGEMMLTTCQRIYVPSTRKVISVFCGRHHTLLLLETGEVMAYGTGLGLGLGLGQGMRLVRGMSIIDNYTSLSISGGVCHNFSLAIPKNLVLVIIGLAHRGVPTALNVIALKDGMLCAALGNGFSILVNRRGCCYAFGLGGWGQLGMDLQGVKDATPDRVPVMRHAARIPYLSRTTITHVSAGVSFTLAVSEGQRVFAWGSNLYGQCGLGVNPKEYNRINEPQEITWLADKLIVQVACGCYFALALSATGEVYSWGMIECCGNGLEPLPSIVPKNIIMGPVGPESRASILLPAKISGLSNIVSIGAGAWHAVALNAIGEVFTWGLGSLGRLGLGFEEDRYTPTKITLRAFITRVGCGIFSSYAISDTGSLYVWGSNDKQHLSHAPGRLLHPTHVLDDVKEVAVGKYYMIALTRSGELRFTGTLEHDNGVYVSHSLQDTDTIPPMLTKGSMEVEGFRPLRVYGGAEHAFVLMEKDSIPPHVITSLHYALRDQPENIIKRSIGRNLEEEKSKAR